MKQVHNFTAGPCILPQQAIDSAIEALKDFKGTGIPVISISHRTKEWEAVMDECRALWKELLNIPEDYEGYDGDFFEKGYAAAANKMYLYNK